MAATPDPRPRVVLADDDVDVLALMKETLERHGYEVTTAADGREALAAIRKNPPDIAVLDLMMPRMSGREVLDEMAKRRISVPVIVISSIGLPMPIRDELVSRYKIRDLIGKPNVYDLLMPAIHRVLG